MNILKNLYDNSGKPDWLLVILGFAAGMFVERLGPTPTTDFGWPIAGWMVIAILLLEVAVGAVKAFRGDSNE